MVRPQILTWIQIKELVWIKFTNRESNVKNEKVTYVYWVTFIEDFQQYLILAMTTEGVFLV